MMIKNWREFYLSENKYSGYHPDVVKLFMMDDAQTQHPNAEAVRKYFKKWDIKYGKISCDLTGGCVSVKRAPLEMPRNWIDVVNTDLVKDIESNTNMQFYSIVHWDSHSQSDLEFVPRESKNTRFENWITIGGKRPHEDYKFLDEFIKEQKKSPFDIMGLVQELSYDFCDDSDDHNFTSEFIIRSNIEYMALRCNSEGNIRYFDEGRLRPRIRESEMRGDGIYQLKFQSQSRWQYVEEFASHLENFYNRYVFNILKRIDSEFGIIPKIIGPGPKSRYVSIPDNFDLKVKRSNDNENKMINSSLITVEFEVK